MRRILFCSLVITAFAHIAQADDFGDGDNAFEIDFVTIGSPGNAPDDAPNPAGAVPYVYRMGKYEISEQMIDKANALGSLGITKDTRGPDKPATSITWLEAAKFVNWLNTSTGSVPAYKFDDTGSFQLWLPADAGYDANNLYRNKFATYFLPSIDEWHKAAFYDPLAGHYWDYPTGSDTIPDGTDFFGDPDFEAVFNDGASNLGPNHVANVGLLSPFGTAGQGGNVYEWDETAFDRVNNLQNEQRRTSGGSWGSIYTVLNATNTLIGTGPLFDANFVGFRVASVVPEPGTLSILGVSFGVIGVSSTFVRRRRREHHTLWLGFVARETRAHSTKTK